MATVEEFASRTKRLRSAKCWHELARRWNRAELIAYQTDHHWAVEWANPDASADIPSALYPTDNRDQVYTYDGLHRLKTFDEGTLVGSSISGPPEREEDFTLDQLGNWPGYVKKSAGTTDLNQTRTHNAANELETISTWVNPVHDAAGNMTSMPHPASPANTSVWLKYDAWNRLVTASAPFVGPIVTFEYDGLGRRIGKNRTALIGGGTFDYYYNEQWQLLEERKDGSPNPVAQYVWHPYYIDALAVRYWDSNTDGDYLDTNEGAHYYLQDANYNVTAVVNASGTVLERYSYTPYGEVTYLNPDFTTKGATTIGNTHLFTGRERDSETGLQLNRHRFYASHLGRWVNRDPIKYEGSRWNLYEYVESRPIVERDPSGMGLGRLIRKCFKWLRGGAKKKDRLKELEERYADDLAKRAREGRRPPRNKKMERQEPDDPEGWFQDPWAIIPIPTFLGGEYSSGDFLQDFTPVGDVVDFYDWVWGQPPDESFEDHLPIPGQPGEGGPGTDEPPQTGPPFSGPGFTCFVKGTVVYVGKGTAVPIESLKVGQSVVTFSLDKKSRSSGEIQRVFSRQVDELVFIKVGEEEILTTSEHPFFVVEKGWTRAIELIAGDQLITIDGKRAKIMQVGVRNETSTVYNLTVAGEHNYFVGKAGYLVHNKLP